MAIQFILTAFFFVLLVFGIGAIGRSRFIAYSLFGLALIALYFIWNPEQTNNFAHALGVGRGADLLLYLWFLVSSFMLLLMNLKCNRLQQELTETVRHIALMNSRSPDR